MRPMTLSLFVMVALFGISPAFAARTDGGARETQVYRTDGSLISGDEAARILGDATELAGRSPERGVQVACAGFYGNGGPARPCPVGPGPGVIIIRPAPGFVPYVPPAVGWAPAPLFEEGEVTVRRRTTRDYDEEEVTITRRRGPGFSSGAIPVNTCRSGVYYRTYAASNLVLGERCWVPVPGVWGVGSYD